MVGFCKPSSSGIPSPHLFVANCGPALGIPLSQIRCAFLPFGHVSDVREADASGCRVIVTFERAADAESALSALNSLPCPSLGDRTLHIQYSVARPTPIHKAKVSPCVFLAAAQTGIRGLFLYRDFITEQAEQELLDAVDERSWQHLSKRRVQHYGFEFQYETRNVDVKGMGKLPDFTSSVVERISALPELMNATEVCLPLDQLTVNEYRPGVGLSPHIDTHSAFEGAIISLSLAGTCVMEFRKYDTTTNSLTSVEERSEGETSPNFSCSIEVDHDRANSSERCCFEQKSIFLPERSLLVLLDEARYIWHHYIPHHKVDMIGERIIHRKQRRVSFTFRKVRNGPCRCSFPSVCDSQLSSLQIP